jgi:hypothetical protein
MKLRGSLLLVDIRFIRNDVSTFIIPAYYHLSPNFRALLDNICILKFFITEDNTIGISIDPNGFISKGKYLSPKRHSILFQDLLFNLNKFEFYNKDYPYKDIHIIEINPLPNINLNALKEGKYSKLYTDSSYKKIYKTNTNIVKILSNDKSVVENLLKNKLIKDFGQLKEDTIASFKSPNVEVFYNLNLKNNYECTV